MKPKLKTIAYWVTTALVGLDFIAGGLANLARVPEAVAGMTHFGYPAYFTPLSASGRCSGASSSSPRACHD